MSKRGLFSQVPNDPPTITILSAKHISEKEALEGLGDYVKRTTSASGGPFAPQEKQFTRVKLMHDAMLQDASK